jgi:hypothetical protein
MPDRGWYVELVSQVPGQAGALRGNMSLEADLKPESTKIPAIASTCGGHSYPVSLRETK